MGRMMMRLTLFFAISIFIADSGFSQTNPAKIDLSQLSLSQLETKLSQLDLELPGLAKPSMRTGVGAIGYRSKVQPSDQTGQWVQIDLSQETSIDQIVLVPTIWRDTQTGFRADGFPLKFRILVGSRDDDDGREVALFDLDPHRLPRVAPFVVPCKENKVSWVRLETLIMSERAWDGKRTLQLSEIAVFRGRDNVALGQSVTASSDDTNSAGTRSKNYLVDGFVPYLMDAGNGEQSIAYVGNVLPDSQPILTIDLEAVHCIDRVHLHSTDISDTVPQSLPSNFGIPSRFVILGAKEPDFSDAVELADFEVKRIRDAGPMIMRGFAPTFCRYVRLRVLEPYRDPETPSISLIGFAEIELFADGMNVAKHKSVTSNMPTTDWSRSLAAITDGNNFYGSILPCREWFAQLAKRHDLETLRPLVVAELNFRYQRQKTNLQRAIILASLLAAASLFAVLIGWVMRQRAVLRTREQIAADLHDELGANLHAIGLLSDLAQTSAQSPSKLEPLMERIRELTERTGTAAAYCANLLESRGLYEDLPAEMRRSSMRIMTDLQHKISFEGEDLLGRLSARKKIDLYLFHKECLVNIIRHSDATKATSHVYADARQIRLTITDNGCGLMQSDGSGKLRNGIPPSLKRRSRLLGANVFVDKSDDGGTRVTLQMKTSRSKIKPTKKASL